MKRIIEPTVLVNPKDTVVEFYFDSKPVIFQPGEERMLPGPIADHAMRFVNTGLKLKGEEIKEEPKEEKSSLEDLSWPELQRLASKRGLFKLGMNKEEVIAALKGE